MNSSGELAKQCLNRIVDLWQKVDVNSEEFETLVGTFARFMTSTYGWVYPTRSVLSQFGSSANSAELWLQVSVSVNDQNAGWLTYFFANMSIIQAINAQIQGPKMLGIIGSGIA